MVILIWLVIFSLRAFTTNTKKIHNIDYNVIVGIRDDKTVESYKRKPILNMKERMEIIQSCKYINLVIPNAPLIIKKKYLEENNIDMVFHAHSLEEKRKI